ncbi:hypothetical protein TNCV_1713551 [Trichonephila clavipes]|nr:hypothetical protein TNCV_1713551 [Trichonephila clavipes]
MVTRELWNRGTVCNGHTFADGYVYCSASVTAMKVSRFRWGDERVSSTVAESANKISCDVLLSVGAPRSIFCIQISGDEDVTLVPEDSVQILL